MYYIHYANILEVHIERLRNTLVNLPHVNLCYQVDLEYCIRFFVKLYMKCCYSYILWGNSTLKINKQVTLLETKRLESRKIKTLNCNYLVFCNSERSEPCDF